MDSNNITLMINKIINILYLTVCIIGFTANKLTWFVFSRKKFQNTIFSTYFRALCLFNSLTILFRIDTFLDAFDLKNIKSYSSFSCHSYYYFIYVIPDLSNWTAVVISIDRMISILSPNQYSFRKKKKFQLFIILILILINLVLNTSTIFLIDFINTNSSNQTNDYICNNEGVTLDLIDIIYSVLIPFTLMIMFNTIIIKKIHDSRTKSHNSSSSIKKKDIKFAITSITLNILFFVLLFPFTFFFIIVSIIQMSEDETYNILYNILSLIFYSYYGSVFFSTYASNSLFRKEFHDLIKEIKAKLIAIFR